MNRFVAVALVLVGCERLELVAADSGVTDGGPPSDAGISRFESSPSDGGTRTVAAALSDRDFIAFDFETGSEVPFELDGWDIAFRRQRIRLRGGVNGDGGVCAQVVVDAGLNDVTAVPAGPCLVDQPDGPDTNTEPDTVFENAETWYAYNSMTHVLTPRPLVYVVRSDQGRFYAVSINGYYDEAGTPAFVRFLWKAL